MKALILFERSGCVSQPLREYGIDCVTVDLLPYYINNNHHIIGDISDILSMPININDFITNISYTSGNRDITPIAVGYAMCEQWLDFIKNKKG